MSKPYILLVDDDLTVIDSLLNQLKNRFSGSYVFETAQSVGEAFEVLDDLKKDGKLVRLVITDWLMPPENADAFLKRVANDYPDTYLIMLSGFADEESVEKAFTFPNFKAFVRKPWEEEELVNEIKKYLPI